MNREQRRRKIQPKPQKAANEEQQIPLGMRVGADFKTGLVLVQFNRRIDNMTFTPDGARQFAAAVSVWAKKIEESNGAHKEAGSALILPPGLRDQ